MYVLYVYGRKAGVGIYSPLHPTNTTTSTVDGLIFLLAKAPSSPLSSF
jgi:hypothetical protein